MKNNQIPAKQKIKPKLMYAVVYKDEYGQTVSLFAKEEHAKEYLENAMEFFKSK